MLYEQRQMLTETTTVAHGRSSLVDAGRIQEEMGGLRLTPH